MRQRLTPTDIRRFPAHIFDMDGTLLDSEPLHLKALSRVFQQYDIPFKGGTQELARLCLGKSDEDVFLEFCPDWSREKALKAVEDKNRMMIEVLEQTAQSEVQNLLTPGILDYLKLLNRLKRQCFVLTASEQAVVPPLLEKAGLFHFFADTQSRNQSFRTKPSSSPYLSLMRKYQFTTIEVIIYEDSPTGLAAAEETGAHVIHMTAHCEDSVLSKFQHLQQADNFLWLLIK